LFDCTTNAPFCDCTSKNSHHKSKKDYSKHPKPNTTTTMMMNYQLSLVAIAAFLGAASAYEVPSLTPDNYDEITGGKTVFIKFFAPWVSQKNECIAVVVVAALAIVNRND
jgi:hypothetical protein